MNVELPELLKKALQRGEGEKVEFRRTFGGEVIRTLCAFANTKGGEVWLGIANDGTVIGTPTGSDGLNDGAQGFRRCWTNAPRQGFPSQSLRMLRAPSG
ncbi:ATP-binding protein [Candidatus Poribacteria bacterium]|nr:ATP-binding protein [Candidatus Poribacteria bacterium]